MFKPTLNIFKPLHIKKEPYMWFFSPAPNKPYMFRYLGNRTFIVEESSNSKLKTGDTFACSLFVLGEPLYIDNLIQNGRPPVAFVVGSKSGLTLLEHIQR